MQKYAEAGEKQVGKIRSQMTGRFHLNGEWQLAAPNPRQEFLAGLNGTFGPAMLLRLESIHVHRQFRRRDHVGEKNKFPARELRAVTKIEIFAKRIVLPAAGFLDAGAAPKSGGTVKSKETTAAAARGLLEKKVAIEKHRLHARKQRVAAIQMAPSRLDHSHVGVGKEVDRALEQLRLRHEIRVENANEFAVGTLDANGQRAGLESGAIFPVNELHVKTATPQFISASRRNFARIV